MFTSILPKPSQYGWIAQKFSLYHHGLTLYSTWLNGFWTKSCLFASGSRHRYWFLPHCIILPSTNSALPLFRLRQPEFEPYERLAVCQYYFPEVLMGARHVIVHSLTTALCCGASSALWTLFDNDVSCSVRVATMHIVIVLMSRCFLSSNNMNLVTNDDARGILSRDLRQELGFTLCIDHSWRPRTLGKFAKKRGIRSANLSAN